PGTAPRLLWATPTTPTTTTQTGAIPRHALFPTTRFVNLEQSVCARAPWGAVRRRSAASFLGGLGDGSGAQAHGGRVGGTDGGVGRGEGPAARHLGDARRRSRGTKPTPIRRRRPEPRAVDLAARRREMERVSGRRRLRESPWLRRFERTSAHGGAAE